MKYFTLDDWIGSQGTETVDMESIRRMQRSYEDYIAGISDHLPPDLLRFHQTVRTHDSDLRRMTLNVAQKQLVMTVDTYPVDAANILHLHTVELQYTQVVSLESTADGQKGLPGPSGYGDLGNNEIELLGNGVFEHRFLFSSGIELSVQFGGFGLREIEEE